ncbi:hypothetical protein SAMN05192529_1308 [Arachidicoccus rhizosphaerae]|uniref:Uncharacterized protein n=1 Tax=Arachidicoccus rhizosphaerae TaxID=551991 RepID=A0A1H4CCH7_9BACT|nr:hypothetical protein SAMN05192529_1308 [Arachidicoccus rhizosphaerae]
MRCFSKAQEECKKGLLGQFNLENMTLRQIGARIRPP